MGSSVRARLRPSVCVRMCKGSAAQARPLPPPSPLPPPLAATTGRWSSGSLSDPELSRAGTGGHRLPGRARPAPGCRHRAKPRGGGEMGRNPRSPPGPPHPDTPPLLTSTRVGRVSPFAPRQALEFIYSLICFSTRLFTPSQPHYTGKGGPAGRAPRFAKDPPQRSEPSRVLCQPLLRSLQPSRAPGRLQAMAPATLPG